HKGIRTEFSAPICQLHFTADASARQQPYALRFCAQLDSFLGETKLLINLERPRLHADRFGKLRDALVFLNQHEVDAKALDVAAQQKAGWASSHDDHVCRGSHRRLSLVR